LKWEFEKQAIKERKDPLEQKIAGQNLLERMRENGAPPALINQVQRELFPTTSVGAQENTYGTPDDTIVSSISKTRSSMTPGQSSRFNSDLTGVYSRAMDQNYQKFGEPNLLDARMQGRYAAGLDTELPAFGTLPLDIQRTNAERQILSDLKAKGLSPLAIALKLDQMRQGYAGQEEVNRY
jgi:hypothetical protein